MCGVAPASVVPSPLSLLFLLDRLFERCERLEADPVLGGDLDRLARAGIPPLPGLALVRGEAAEVGDAHGRLVG